MPSARIVIMVSEDPVTVKDPLWAWTSDGKAVLMPSFGFEWENLLDLQNRVLREVTAVVKAFEARDKKDEPESVKVSD